MSLKELFSFLIIDLHLSLQRACTSQGNSQTQSLSNASSHFPLLRWHFPQQRRATRTKLLFRHLANHALFSHLKGDTARACASRSNVRRLQPALSDNKLGPVRQPPRQTRPINASSTKRVGDACRPRSANRGIQRNSNERQQSFPAHRGP